MKKICIIGHFGGNKNFNDGQTVKTLEITNYIENYFNVRIDKIDTFYNSKKPIKLLLNTFKAMKNNEKIILVVSSRGYRILAPLIAILNIFFKRKIYDLVIGGSRHLLYDKSKLLTKSVKAFTKIYVETEKLKSEYKVRNINNIEILHNFKKLPIIELNSFKRRKTLNICTFSRVNIYKGIEEAIESVRLANEYMGKNVFFLDIYGKVDNDYKERFNTVLQSLPSFVQYQGEVPFDESVQTLQKYDLMLFLTYWKGEGFPGTLLDTLFSGTPIIATDWNCNFEILTDKKNALKVQVHDVEKVAELLVELYKNQEKLYEMKKECLASAKLYTPDCAMKDFIEELKKDK